MTLADLAVAALDPRVRRPDAMTAIHVRRPRVAPFTPGGRRVAGVHRTEVTAHRRRRSAGSSIRFDRRALARDAAPARRRAVRAVTPDGVDVGSLAWEYGGGSYLVAGSGGRLLPTATTSGCTGWTAGGSPAPLTPAP